MTDGIATTEHAMRRLVEWLGPDGFDVPGDVKHGIDAVAAECAGAITEERFHRFYNKDDGDEIVVVDLRHLFEEWALLVAVLKEQDGKMKLVTIMPESYVNMSRTTGKFEAR